MRVIGTYINTIFTIKRAGTGTTNRSTMGGATTTSRGGIGRRMIARLGRVATRITRTTRPTTAINARRMTHDRVGVGRERGGNGGGGDPEGRRGRDGISTMSDIAAINLFIVKS